MVVIEVDHSLPIVETRKERRSHPSPAPVSNDLGSDHPLQFHGRLRRPGQHQSPRPFVGHEQHDTHAQRAGGDP